MRNTTLLCILDGFGLAPASSSNAISEANTPFIDQLFAERPNAELRTDGEYVGVVPGQMGNSEVGHITIGSGRVFQQALPKINDDLASGNLGNNEAYQSFLKDAKATIHIVGLLSDGGIHSHIDHLIHLCEDLNARGRCVVVHAILDGRDTGVTEGKGFVEDFSKRTSSCEYVSLGTMIGRFYAMDRDERWERTEKAWRLYTEGLGESFGSPTAALEKQYEKEVFDEFIEPLVYAGEEDSCIRDNDAVLMFNFRADRMRQLTRCLIGQGGLSDDCKRPGLSALASFTEYDAKFEGHCQVLYPKDASEDCLGKVVSDRGLKQLRIAETEKYPHVTFFFNNGREEPYAGEDRVLINSPKEVDTYDQKPEMSLPEVADTLIDKIESGAYDLIVLNIANGDMVGHTGNWPAALEAVQAIDKHLKRISDTISAHSGNMLIIADHGNIEEMKIGETASTAHSTNPVPCIYLDDKQQPSLVNGSLRDVAPTILEMMDQEIPGFMDGQSLLR